MLLDRPGETLGAVLGVSFGGDVVGGDDVESALDREEVLRGVSGPPSCATQLRRGGPEHVDGVVHRGAYVSVTAAAPENVIVVSAPVSSTPVSYWYEL